MVNMLIKEELSRWLLKDILLAAPSLAKPLTPLIKSTADRVLSIG